MLCGAHLDEKLNFGSSEWTMRARPSAAVREAEMEGASVQLCGAATGSETSSQGGEWPRMVGFSLAEAAFNDAFSVARATLPTTMMDVSPRPTAHEES